MSRFDTNALLVCIGTPWIALLLKIFYFDLSQYHGADAGSHAVTVSTGRAAVWSLLHLPLIGTVLWIGCAVQDLVSTREDDVSHQRERWGVFAAMGSYLALCTIQQLLHQGLGRGRRRIGKRMRMAVRLLFVLASGIVAASCGMRWLPSPRRGTLLGYVVGATGLAAFELFGRGRRGE